MSRSSTLAFFHCPLPQGSSSSSSLASIPLQATPRSATSGRSKFSSPAAAPPRSTWPCSSYPSHQNSKPPPRPGVLAAQLWPCELVAGRSSRCSPQPHLHGRAHSFAAAAPSLAPFRRAQGVRLNACEGDVLLQPRRRSPGVCCFWRRPARDVVDPR
jgi:hypothetical protein